MVHAVKPPAVESARKSHLECVAIVVADRVDLGLFDRRVDRLSIDARNARDVLRRLQPSLDLEARDAALDQRRHVVDGREILRREQILAIAEVLLLPVDEQVVRHAASLRTFAAIGASLPERLTREALPGVRDAKRAVHEDLERQHVGAAHLVHLLQRPLASENDTAHAETSSETHAFSRRDRHLRRCVHLEPRRDLASETRETEVLNDDRIDAACESSLVKTSVFIVT